MSALSSPLESFRRSLSLSWWVWLPFLVLLGYILSTGPVCRWSWRLSHKIYTPLNPLATSKIMEPLVRKWLWAWRGLPWWSLPSPPKNQRKAQIGDWTNTSYAAYLVVGTANVAKLEQAANSGDAAAQMRLATYLYEGKFGVPKNS